MLHDFASVDNGGGRPPQPTIAIIGGGCSGTLTAVQLLRQACCAGDPAGELCVVLFERSGIFGRGVAYGTRSPQHVLNVPADRMSALPDDPGHFLHWAQQRDPTAHGRSFLPRSMYGEYLEALLTDTARRTATQVGFERRVAEVVDLLPGDGTQPTRLILDNGVERAANHVVLALGNFPPADPVIGDKALLESPNYVRNPWSPEAIGGLAPDADVLLIGSGLTAVDVLAELDARGHRGRIFAVSRHGLLPHAHIPVQHPHPFDLNRIGQRTARAALRAIRHEAAQAEVAGDDWRVAIEGLRPRVAELWRSLPLAERARFIRHLRSFWDVHRHRVAPEVAAILHRWRDTGRLRVIAGRIESAAATGRDGVRVAVRLRGADDRKSFDVARVINCTGPDGDIRRVTAPLVQHLLARRIARPDELGLGFDTAPDGALLAHDGVAWKNIHTIGPLRRPALWESTAVPEIRTQAAALAHALLLPSAPQVRSPRSGALGSAADDVRNSAGKSIRAV